jgi:hypothetical protein
MGIEQIRQLKLAAASKPKPVQKGTPYLSKQSLVNNGSFPHVKRGDYETSKGSTFFRSKWEANYALYLDFLIKQKVIKGWEFEAQSFFFEKIKSGTKKYIPDFKVTMIDGSIEFHEVKGFMQQKDRTKIRRMAKYFPDVKLVLIDKVFYNDLYKKFKTVLKFY